MALFDYPMVTIMIAKITIVRKTGVRSAWLTDEPFSKVPGLKHTLLTLREAKVQDRTLRAFLNLILWRTC
jgi:hypothetical protein